MLERSLILIAFHNVSLPFNDHASHHSGSCFFGYNSPAAIAREFFKPSTVAENHLGSI